MNQQMSEQERKDFEKRLEVDENLSEELMRMVAHESYKYDLKKEFDTYESKNTKSGQKTLFRKVSKVAAIMLLLMIPAAFIFYYSTASTCLITTEYMDYPSHGNHRSSSSSEYQPMSEAYEAIRNQDFEKASAYFDGSLSDEKLKPESHLYAGISLLWAKKDAQTELAVQHFREVLTTENDRNDAARWFLALGQFELGNKEEARLLFQEIANNPRHFRQQQAVVILEKYY